MSLLASLGRAASRLSTYFAENCRAGDSIIESAIKVAKEVGRVGSADSGATATVDPFREASFNSTPPVKAANQKEGSNPPVAAAKSKTLADNKPQSTEGRSAVSKPDLMPAPSRVEDLGSFTPKPRQPIDL